MADKKTEKPNGMTDLIQDLKLRLEGIEPEQIPHKELMELVTVGANALSRKREYYKEQSSAIKEEVSGIRASLPNADEDDDDEEERRGPGRPRGSRSSGRAPRARNTEKMSDYALKVFKEAGRKGLTRVEAAQAAKKAGFKTSVKDISQFAASFYVSGIYPLIKEGVVEQYREEGGGRTGKYRLKK